MISGRSRARPDSSHAFGYGMEAYFWTFVVAVIVLLAGGVASIYEGVRQLARNILHALECHRQLLKIRRHGELRQRFQALERVRRVQLREAVFLQHGAQRQRQLADRAR